MFALPQAKRVRRADLYSPRSSPESTSSNEESDGNSSAVIQNDFSRHIEKSSAVNIEAKPESLKDHETTDAAQELHSGEEPNTLLNIDTSQRSNPASKAGLQGDINAQQDTENDTYAFRLFSSADRSSQHPSTIAGTTATNSAVPPIQHIRLVSPSRDQPCDAPNSFRPRPTSYYLSRALSPSERAVALPASTILALSRRHCSGLAHPWRVIHIPSSSAPAAATEQRQRRTKPGKKARVASRRRVEAKEAARRAEEERERSKSEHLKAKKAKVNRAKQMKKREKARAAKVEEGAVEG